MDALKGTWRFGVCVGLLVFSLFVFPGLALTDDPGPDQAEEWASPGGIQVNVLSPANNSYVTINSETTLTGEAHDPDCYRVGTEWYACDDDVTSGDASSDYHMWWVKHSGDGTLTDTYGTSATYSAPDYSAGNNVRDVVIRLHADDFNRGTDTYGYDDDYNPETDYAVVTLKVWQVVVTVSQAGNSSANYDGTDAPATHGGTDLGWVIPGTPAGATGYHGNTQITGTIPAGVPTMTGFTWRSQDTGVARRKVSGGAWGDLINHANWTDDNPGAIYQDQDSRHPNTTGPNVREIFMVDAPGFTAGATNDAKIAAPDNWTDVNFNFDFRSWVELGGVRVSNQPVWEVEFTLDVNAGTWRVVGGHTP